MPSEYLVTLRLTLQYNLTLWGPQTIAKLVYNFNNYGLWYLKQ